MPGFVSPVNADWLEEIDGPEKQSSKRRFPPAYKVPPFTYNYRESGVYFANEPASKPAWKGSLKTSMEG